MAIFGYNVQGTYGIEPLNNIIAGLKATPASSGTLSTITAWLTAPWVAGATIKVKCALYRASDNTLVAVSNERTWTNNVDAGWYDFTCSATVSATETYIIAIWASHSTGGYISVANDNDLANPLGILQSLTYGTFPNVLAGSTSSHKYSIYATYTEGATPPWQLTIQADAGGTTDPVPNVYSVLYNTSASVLATVNPNYSFAGWLLDGVLNMTNPITVGPYTDGSSHVLQATFTPLPIPTVSLPATASGMINAPITVTATPSGGSGTYVNYHWYIDGVEANGSPTTTPSMIFTSSTAGTFNITATVTDSNGQTSALSAPCVVTVNEPLPKPSVSLPSSLSGTVNIPVTVTASPSGGSGIYTAYHWYINGVEPNGSPTATPSMEFTSPSAGTFNITVTVTDNQSQTSDLSNVCVVTISSPAVPSVTLPSSASGLVNAVISIIASPSGGSGSYTRYDWYVDGVFLTNTTVATLSFTSDVEGTASITVTVTDSNSQTSPMSNACVVTVTVPEASGRFGKTTVGTGTYGNGPRIQGGLYPLSENANVTSISLYVPMYFGVAPLNVKCAIYDAAFNLLGVTESKAITNAPSNPINIWFTFVFPAPIVLVAGNYWLCWFSDQNLIVATDTSTTSGTMFDSQGDYATGFPASLLGYKDLLALNPSVYASYGEAPALPWNVTISVSPAGSGTTNPTGTVDVPSGEGLTATATPIGNNVFDHWEFDGVVATMPIPAQADNSSHALVAVFTPVVVPVPWHVTISVSPVGSGTTNPTGIVDVPSGQSLTVTPTAASNNSFDHWEFDGVVATMPIPAQADNSSHALIAYFTVGVLQPTVTLPSNASGYLNQVILIGASARGGSGSYSNYAWYVDDVYEATTTTPTFNFMRANAGTYNVMVVVTDSAGQTGTSPNPCVVTVTAPVNPTLTLLVSPAGTATTTQNPSPPYILNQQVTIAVSIIDPANYTFVHWTKEDGSELSTSPSLMILMDTNHTYTAVLEVIGHPTLTINATVGGSLAITQETRPPPYNTGDVVAVTATPAVGYRLAGWLRDGVPYVDNRGDPIANPINIVLDQSYTLTAKFELSAVEFAIPWWAVLGGVGAVVVAYAVTR